jgi:hypothetical protein
MYAGLLFWRLLGSIVVTFHAFLGSLLPCLLLLLARCLLGFYLFALLSFALTFLGELLVLGLDFGSPGLGVTTASSAVVLLAES